MDSRPSFWTLISAKHFARLTGARRTPNVLVRMVWALNVVLAYDDVDDGEVSNSEEDDYESSEDTR